MVALVHFQIFVVRFEELCTFLALDLLAMRAFDDCRGIERAIFLNSFPFLKYLRISLQEDERLIFLDISRKERNFRNRLTLNS